VPDIVLVTLLTGFAIACIVETACAVAPVVAVRVESAGAALGAVAAQADVAAGVAGLAGAQAAPCLAGMSDGPVMKIGGNRTLQVAGIALGRVDPRMNGADVATEAQVKRPTMGRPGSATDTKIVVAVVAELRFMAACAQLLVGSCRQRMCDVKVAAVHVDHVVAERALLVGETRLVALQAVVLLMAGGAVDRVALGLRAMVERPHGAMGFDGAQICHIDQFLIMAVETNLFVGNDACGIIQVTGGAFDAGNVFLKMGAMIKPHACPGQGNARRQQQ